MPSNIRTLSRAELYAIFKTDQAVRLVEELIYAINNTIPDDVSVVQANLDTHIADPTDAHQASAIGYTPHGSIAANTVQAAINELDAEKQPQDATLTALAALVTAADRLIYATGVDTFALTTLSAFARTFLDDADAATVRATIGAGTGSGSVTTVSVASANGFGGSVATPGTTPSITLTTSLTGLLKGNGTAMSAAAAGADYSAGTSGLATGIVKSTTGTGALTIAVAADFPTLNQNTTGSAAKLTTPRNINGTAFDGTADITVTAAAGSLTGATLAAGVTASSLTSVGTLGTGTWQATVIAGQYGGTGVANTGKTITVGGNLTTSGAFASTFTMTGVTTVTFPTTGTLATLGGAETFTSKTLTAPVINNPTGTMTLASGSLGYAAGNGGTVAQATSKATGVTLDKISGEITMNAAALAAGTIVSFVLTNSTIAATDVIVRNHVSGGTIGAYTIEAVAAAGSATIYVRNNTAGSLSEAVVIRFAVLKAATT